MSLSDSTARSSRGHGHIKVVAVTDSLYRIEMRTVVGVSTLVLDIDEGRALVEKMTQSMNTKKTVV